MAWVDLVAPDELRRAFAVALVTDAGSATGSSLEDVLTARFADEKIDAPMARVVLLMLWLETDPDPDLVGFVSPLGVPDLHPAVLDVAATHRIPADGLPKPRPFFRALQQRVRNCDVVRGAPA